MCSVRHELIFSFWSRASHKKFKSNWSNPVITLILFEPPCYDQINLVEQFIYLTFSVFIFKSCCKLELCQDLGGCSTELSSSTGSAPGQRQQLSALMVSVQHLGKQPNKDITHSVNAFLNKTTRKKNSSSVSPVTSQLMKLHFSPAGGATS